MSQRHSNYYGFVKTGSAFFFALFGAHGLFFVSFWSPLDFEGGSQIYHFLKKQKKEKKWEKEVQETAMKKHDFLIDFWY